MTDLIHNWVQQHRRLHNYMAASHELKLTPQEQYAYRHHLSNLGRGGVPHADGSLSSFLNTTFEIEGRTYVLPTVWDNQIVSEDEALQRAKQDGLNKWPSYDSEEAATNRYNAMHAYMERDTEKRLNAHPIEQPSGNNDPGAMDQGNRPTGPQRFDR